MTPTVIACALLGALMDMVRGRLYVDDIINPKYLSAKQYAALEFFLVNGKAFNPLVFAAMCYAVGASALVAVLAGAAMFIGNMFGWGAYAGPAVTGGWNTGKAEEEIGIIDRIIAPLDSQPFLYGIAGLALRGLIRSVALAAALLPHAGIALLLSGALMGGAFYLGGRIDLQRGWKIGEALTGAVLWGAAAAAIVGG